LSSNCLRIISVFCCIDLNLAWSLL
jgi:hypothetical protein